MDLQAVKEKIDLKHEHNALKKQYEFRKKELKRKEIRKIFTAFKDFFKKDRHFGFKENEHSITAEYKEHGIRLDIDIYKNIDNPEYAIEGSIKTFEKVIHYITAHGNCNKDLALSPGELTEDEKLKEDIRYFGDFLEGNIVYTFSYKIVGHEEEYASIGQLLEAL